MVPNNVELQGRLLRFVDDGCRVILVLLCLYIIKMCLHGKQQSGQFRLVEHGGQQRGEGAFEFPIVQKQRVEPDAPA